MRVFCFRVSSRCVRSLGLIRQTNSIGSIRQTDLLNGISLRHEPTHRAILTFCWTNYVATTFVPLTKTSAYDVNFHSRKRSIWIPSTFTDHYGPLSCLSESAPKIPVHKSATNTTKKRTAFDVRLSVVGTASCLGFGQIWNY